MYPSRIFTDLLFSNLKPAHTTRFENLGTRHS